MTDKARRGMYKFGGRGDPEEMRRRREGDAIELRRQKRDEQLAKRRNVGTQQLSSTEDEESMGESAKQEFGISAEMVAAINSGDPAQEYEATQKFRKILSKEPNPPIDKVLECNILPKLVQFLSRYDNSQLQFEAAWALTNIASGTTDNTRAVVAAGAVPVFIQLMYSDDENVQDQAIWALGNIAGDNPELRDFVLGTNANAGMLPPLLTTLNSPRSINIARNAVWALSNLCRGKKPPPNFSVVSAALPTLRHVLQTQDDQDVLSDACWAISYLADGPNEKIQAVVDSNVVPTLVELLRVENQNVVSAALRAIGNIVTGNDVQTQLVLECGALPHLKSIILRQNIREPIRKEACWTVSNITAGDRRQIQLVLEAGLVPIMIEVLSSAQYKTKREAAWAITNAMSGGNAQQIQFIIDQGVIPPLCELLASARNDVKCLEVALNGLEIILKHGQDQMDPTSDANPFTIAIEQCYGLEKLEGLQDHENEEIYNRVVNIIERYFGVEDDADEQNSRVNLQPAADASGFQFGLPPGQQQQPQQQQQQMHAQQMVQPIDSGLGSNNNFGGGVPGQPMANGGFQF